MTSSWQLQEISGNTDQSSESATEDCGLVGNGTTLRWGRNWWGGNVGGNGWVIDDWVLGWWSWRSVSGDSDVGVGWGVSWLVASTRALGLGDGCVGVSTGAWAVGDGQGSGLSDGVGVVVLHNGGWVWAVGGVFSDDLSCGPLGLVTITVAMIRDDRSCGRRGLVTVTVAVAFSRDGNNAKGSSEEGRGTHFDLGFWGWWLN